MISSNTIFAFILLAAAVVVGIKDIKITYSKNACASACKTPYFDPNHYLKFEGFVSWDDAEEACSSYPGNVSLISIESTEEMDFLTCYLDSCKDTGKFWTNGIYDEELQNYVWKTYPWCPIALDSGYWGKTPPKPASSQTRIFIKRNVFGAIYWDVAQKTDELMSFICEIYSVN